MSKAKQRDNVIRIPNEYYMRLQKLKGNRTYAAIMQDLIDIFELVDTDEKVFIADKQVFNDVAEARGAAILASIRDKASPAWPQVAVVIGHDPAEAAND